MFIIAGLGNPGKQYEFTRHNMGFMVLDKLAEKAGISINEKKHKALIGKGMLGSEKVVLVKPQTFMNLSGESIREVCDFYKIDPKNQLLVIYDDISMDLGAVRIRKEGSAGGHNGIKNIILHTGSETFLRIKMGVGKLPEGFDQVNYVLGHFSSKELEILIDSCEAAISASKLLSEGKYDEAMNKYNKKGIKPCEL